MKGDREVVGDGEGDEEERGREAREGRYEKKAKWREERWDGKVKRGREGERERGREALTPQRRAAWRRQALPLVFRIKTVSHSCSNHWNVNFGCLSDGTEPAVMKLYDGVIQVWKYLFILVVV